MFATAGPNVISVVLDNQHVVASPRHHQRAALHLVAAGVRSRLAPGPRDGGRPGYECHAHRRGQVWERGWPRRRQPGGGGQIPRQVRSDRIRI